MDSVASYPMTCTKRYPAPVQLTVRKIGTDLEIDFGFSANADFYRISRGSIGGWYSHYTDDSAGIGTCDNGPGALFIDPDDLSSPGDYYYLATGVAFDNCEGPSGNARPARILTLACP